MKIAVVGQDTLATAVAHCCRLHFPVVRQPEPGIDLLWLCYDTPLTAEGAADLTWTMGKCAEAIQQVNPSTPVLISCQLPVGSTASLQRLFPLHRLAYSPENIRVATAVADFAQQSRIVVGTRHPSLQPILAEALSCFTGTIIWTDPETAEMCKHALNCFLGLQIAWINEVARLAGPLGVDMEVVTRSLRSERRVSPVAPLVAGQPFGGGHLARDIGYLADLAERGDVFTPIIDAISVSNAVR